MVAVDLESDDSNRVTTSSAVTATQLGEGKLGRVAVAAVDSETGDSNDVTGNDSEGPMGKGPGKIGQIL